MYTYMSSAKKMQLFNKSQLRLYLLGLSRGENNSESES